MRFNNSGIRHSIFVTGVSGSTVTYGDCNGGANKCQIRWSATMNKNTLSANFIHVRSAPSELN